MSKKHSDRPDSSRDHEGRVETERACARRHFLVGWWTLLVFLTLGIVLEAFHGFKIDWFLNVDMETRRLMWRLAHAHGTLLGLIHLGFGGMVLWATGWSPARRALASSCLSAATVLMPAGFFLGGLFIYDGDPGLGILLVPMGAVVLVVAVFLTALAVGAPLVAAK